MRIVLMRLRGKKAVYLFPEEDRLRVQVVVSGVRGVSGLKIVSEQTPTWKQVIEALHVPVNPSKPPDKPWDATMMPK